MARMTNELRIPMPTFTRLATESERRQALAEFRKARGFDLPDEERIARIRDARGI